MRIRKNGNMQRLKWYPELYAGEGAGVRQKKIIHKLNQNAGMLDIYLITLAVNPANLLEIISSAYLQQKAVRRNLPLIVGIAKGYDEAVQVTVSIIEEVYKATGAFDVRGYLAEKVKPGQKPNQKRNRQV